MNSGEATATKDDADRRHRRRVWIVVTLLVLIPLVVFGSLGAWFAWQLDPPGQSGDTVEVRVDDGWSVTRIGDELVDRDVIGSSLVFSVYSRLKSNSDFQAGTYRLKRDMGVRDAVSALEAGPHLDYTELAVPPGLQVPEIATRVGELPGRSSDAFLAAVRSGAKRSKYQPAGNTSLEGLLWPDTYRVADTDDEIDVLGSMVSEFEQNADAAGLETATTQGRTPYEILTIASLIEAEAKVDEDRPLIASVIYNRLREGMKLQIDATVLYASGDPSKVTITRDDLEMDSPYNTYVREGLPPTPIGSVSDASLRAALAPADTPYFFYVIGDAEGRHKFAETGEEHEQNVEAARGRAVVISGETRLAGIIGDPVRHSLSPVLHNTAYRELGLDWRYLAFEVPDGRTAAALEAARTLGLVGLSVTMPHKTAAAAACTEITEPAARLRSVNTVTLRADGTLHGDSTDGAGFIRSLEEAGVELPGTRALVLGAGGAARPVLVALADACSDITVTVTARRPDAASAAAALVGAATIAWTDRAEAAAEATLVVNATPVGMGDGAIPFDPGALRRGQVVADLVYHPLETPLLIAARAAGAVPIDGLGMLVHQAALQVEHWSGAPAPVAHMRDAARRALQEPR